MQYFIWMPKTYFENKLNKITKLVGKFLDHN